MILEGNERGYGTELARHLLNPRDNDHVTVHAIDGFVADDLFGAFAEAEAISQATQCQKYLFSLSLNPPPDADVSVADFEKSVADAEKRLGLAGQPRVIVFHEKNGRRHAHAVWSRIDGQELKAINIPHYKRKLAGLSQELYRTHDWEMPEGFKDAEKRDPQNFSRQEAEQAKRHGHDPKAQKAMFQRCWQQADSRASFAAALKEEGYLLARGDRRGFVAVDATGKVWSLSRWCGVKPKNLRARLGREDALPRVDDVTDQLGGLRPPKVSQQDTIFAARRATLVERQRAERSQLLKTQETQRIAALKDRQKRLPTGLRAILSRASGQYAKTIATLEAETAKAAEQSRLEQQALVQTHLREHRALKQESQRQGLSQAFFEQSQSDPQQKLVVDADDLNLTATQLRNDPARILEYISHKEAQFTRTDVLRALAKRIDDPMALQEAARTALASPKLITLAESGVTKTYTTHDYVDAEATLDQNAAQLARSGGFGVDTAHRAAAIKSQDRKMSRAFGGALSAEQREALHHVLGDRQLSSVVGLAGAGKSTLLDTARDAWSKQGVTVHGTALAGKAAEELEQASGIPSRTLASLELSWKNGYAPIAKGDVLVVDEAGMVGTRQMARVAEKMQQIGAKLVLVGDPDQLQPIEAGTPFRQVVERYGAAKLTEIHRQKSDWQKQASRALAGGEIAQAVDAYAERGAVMRALDRGEAIDSLVAQYAMDVAADGSASRLAFAHRRKDVHALNQAIRSSLRSASDMESDTMLATATGTRAFGDGERIVFGRNDKDFGIKNGMLGTVQSVSDKEVVVALDGDTPRKVRFDPRRFRYFDHGYAVTIHKSQGATVNQAYVLASRSMDRHLAYVAMTRHREEMRVFVNNRDRPKWAHDPQRHARVPQQRSRDGPSMG